MVCCRRTDKIETIIQHQTYERRGSLTVVVMAAANYGVLLDGIVWEVLRWQVGARHVKTRRDKMHGTTSQTHEFPQPHADDGVD